MRDHCKDLGISASKCQDFGAVRSAYCGKIRTYSKNRDMRIKLNTAYNELCKSIFGVKEREPVLMNCILRGQQEILAYILGKDKGLMEYRTEGDKFPLLYHAVRSGHYDIVKLLLEMGCGKDFSQDRSTPMHCAAYYGHYTLISLLLNYGIPINIPNRQNSLPEDEACTKEIKELLKNAGKNKIMELSNLLQDKKLSEVMVNVNFKGELIMKKIMMRKYFKYFNDSGYEDAFHGTKYASLASIAEHGLKVPGQKAGKDEVKILDGHIPCGTEKQGIKDWAKAVFLSPSIYYASHHVYSEEVIVNESEVWLPVIQVKVKKGSYTKHDHTLGVYALQAGEPVDIELRIDLEQDKRINLINRIEDSSNVQVVAVFFLKKGFLAKQTDYKSMTELILNSSEEKVVRKQRGL